MPRTFPYFVPIMSEKGDLTNEQMDELCKVFGKENDEMTGFFDDLKFAIGRYEQLKKISSEDTASTRNTAVDKIEKTAGKLLATLRSLSLTNVVILNKALSDTTIADVMDANTKLITAIEKAKVGDSDYYNSSKGNSPNHANVSYAFDIANLIEKHFEVKITSSYSTYHDKGSHYANCIKILFPSISDPRDLIEQTLKVLKTQTTSGGLTSYSLRAAWD